MMHCVRLLVVYGVVLLNLAQVILNLVQVEEEEEQEQEQQEEEEAEEEDLILNARHFANKSMTCTKISLMMVRVRVVLAACLPFAPFLFATRDGYREREREHARE